MSPYQVAEARPLLLVMGDFNTPPRGLLYRRLSRRMRDTFRAAGWGWGHTYPTHWPAPRIDYIWVSEGIAVRHCAAPRNGASDHRPVVAEVRLPGAAG